MKSLLSTILLLFPVWVLAQFAPRAGMPGSTALPADSTAFVAWAIDCTVERGWQDIADPDLGLANFGTTEAAIGPAGENGVVSLGDGGSALLRVDPPITDGTGWDFAVFENGFPFGNEVFLELAFVEVSSDGNYFVRFPASSLTDTLNQVDGFTGLEASQLNNLAGKYRAMFGTPFDLSELAGDQQLDITRITHVRLIDVVGSLDNDFVQRDSEGRKINDPYPTPFPSSGFDLDALGVIHQLDLTNTIEQDLTNIQVFPNPLQKGQNLHLSNVPHDLGLQIHLFNTLGQTVYNRTLLGANSPISISPRLPRGWYFLSIQDEQQVYYRTKILIQ